MQNQKSCADIGNEISIKEIINKANEWLVMGFITYILYIFFVENYGGIQNIITLFHEKVSASAESGFAVAAAIMLYAFIGLWAARTDKQIALMLIAPISIMLSVMSVLLK